MIRIPKGLESCGCPLAIDPVVGEIVKYINFCNQVAKLLKKIITKKEHSEFQPFAAIQSTKMQQVVQLQLKIIVSSPEPWDAYTVVLVYFIY